MMQIQKKIKYFITAGLSVTLFFLFSFSKLNAEKIEVEGYEYSFDLPEGWEAFDTSDLSRVSFTDPRHQIVLQVMTFPGEKYFRAFDIYTDIKTQLKAAGDSIDFTFMTKNACIAKLTFKTGKQNTEGYFLFINSDKIDYAIGCFTSADLFDQSLAFIFSALDSFSLNQEGRLYPGPVSYVKYPFPGPDVKPFDIDFNGKKYRIRIDPNELNAAKKVVEREADVLSAYPAGSMEVAKRFYRIIYRDNYHRLIKLFESISKDYKSGKKNEKTFALDALSWIQSFDYETDPKTDLISPIESAVTMKGDCDSRSLVYLILLKNLNIDSVFFLSPVFKHSGIGIENTLFKSNGITLKANGKDYLFAETTKKIPIGNIALDMFEPSEWFPVILPEEQ
jgi:hypothetical protein